MKIIKILFSYLYTVDVHTSVRNVRQNSEITTIVNLFYVLTGIVYLNFPLATERRVQLWHLAAIPTTAKDMVGVLTPVYLRDARIGGEFYRYTRHERAITP